MAEDYKLIDNEEKHRYEFQIDGKIAEIDYIKSNNGEIYLVHTEVPASLGGKLLPFLPVLILIFNGGDIDR